MYGTNTTMQRIGEENIGIFNSKRIKEINDVVTAHFAYENGRDSVMGLALDLFALGYMYGKGSEDV